MDKEFICSAGDLEDVDLIPESGRAHGEGMATHSSTLAWRIPWTEETGVLYSPWGCQELDTTECAHSHIHTHTHTRYICTLYINIYMTEVTEHTPVTLTCFILYLLGNWMFHFFKMIFFKKF